MVAPALEKYSQDRLLGEASKRPGLTPRDRSIVTLAAPIARSQTIEMPYYLNIALDNGVKPREISEIITHLAFYSGWPNAMSAVAAAKDLFAQRQIGSDELPPASPQLLPLDVAAEAQRASRVGEQFGSVAPGVVQYTSNAGHPARRRCMDPAGSEALAWSDGNNRHDAYRHSGISQRGDRRVDGKGQRRAIPQVMMPAVATRHGRVKSARPSEYGVSRLKSYHVLFTGEGPANA